MTGTQPLVAVKAAVYTKLVAQLPATTQISYGEPGDVYQSDQVVIAGAQVQVSYPTFNHQQHDIDLQVEFSCWRDGDSSVQQTATEAALALVETFDAYLRATPTNPLGLSAPLQTVERVLLTSYVVEETSVAEEATYGRLSTVTVTFHTCVRPSMS